MPATLLNLGLAAIIFPLLGALISGVFGKQIGPKGASIVTITGIAASFLCSLILFKLIIFSKVPPLNDTVYTWGITGTFTFDLGFLIDQLTVLMMVTVNFVSLLVHIYSIGYMEGDEGYQRFFSYMSLFTFFMLTLTLANNFLVLFFGWEGVGLVSYLLIGFWFRKESAAQGSLKAFLVNRVGDFGFILGMAAILSYFNSLDYATVFSAAAQTNPGTIEIIPGMHWSVITVICLSLFVGAMGKSAQIPLHVWLPESMEGPTPISALIHAATMVTAGVYMVARASPLFALSPTASGVVLVFGAVGALFLGMLALVENDIKRVIAYSTMSQLGYMMAANGAMAYAAGMFHLVTHACFKALLFLAAGSVIIAMHHEQNMRRMGNLRQYLPITYVVFLIGALSLAAIPPFAGFYSKDSIIEAVGKSAVPGATVGHWCLLIAVFVTSLYIFRAFFMTFHGQLTDSHEPIHEPKRVILVPLMVLAIPSVLLGAVMVKSMLFSSTPLLNGSVYVPTHMNVLAEMAHEYKGIFGSIAMAFISIPFWLSLAGIGCAYLLYVKYPYVPVLLGQRLHPVYKVLVDRYGFDAFNNLVFVRGVRSLSRFFYQVTDLKIIDDQLVNGSGRSVSWLSRVFRQTQTGYLYHYAFTMILGLCLLLLWILY